LDTEPNSSIVLIIGHSHGFTTQTHLGHAADNPGTWFYHRLGFILLLLFAGSPGIVSVGISRINAA